MVGKNIFFEKVARLSRDLKIGDNSGVGINYEIQSNVEIGKNVMMGPEVVIYTENHNTARTDTPMMDQGMMKVRRVIIEDDVWIGRRVIILPGVKVGKGSILGAGSVVAKNVPEFSVVVGNPGKVIKSRLNY
ncbi:acyltransferase [Endozoicomonas gorgoniicola]|uniref:Acyltransferase n=1 Tax=Endozoicomonas gorgoniicola TaxID=1234144 RepID=A0ABT3MQR5_9GAMM|nr:acyltransferase [Endozoicomonas gorgoniicola]MCW7551384.1 acyltransferase [Endozoicomonas gorgoniicola]